MVTNSDRATTDAMTLSLPKNATPANATSPCVLIIDDDQVSNLILKTILNQEGFSTASAFSGPDGRAIAKKLRPELILLDISMRGEDGFQSCRLLKNDPTTADIPVIFITATLDAKSKMEGFDIGAVDYLTKPFDRGEVFARVRVHIRLARANRAMVESYIRRLDNLNAAQRAIVPKPEDHPKAHFAVYYRSREEAGGDFYDVIEISEEHCDYIVADVSGHDLGASLATAALKALIHQNVGPLYTPEESLKIINRVMRSFLLEGCYLTLAYVRLNRRRGLLKLVSAGHPAIITVGVNGTLAQWDQQGDVLGVFEDAVFASHELYVSPGTRFFVSTDGLLEHDNLKAIPRREGMARLIDQLGRCKGQGLEVAVQQTGDALFPSGVALPDDVLLLGVEV